MSIATLKRAYCRAALLTSAARLRVTNSEERFGQSQWLKLRVRRGGRVVAELTFPASSIERLDDLLDDDLRQKIAAQGVDLAAVVDSSRTAGFEPGPIFELVNSEKEVAVWLE